MEAAISGLLGALIGAVVVILNSFLANQHQIQLERQRAALQVTQTMTDELRTHIAHAAQAMLSAQHSMEWICWYGAKGGGLLDEQIIAQYHQEIHETFPKLLGFLAVVASFDMKLYERLAQLAEKLYAVDTQISSTIVEYKDAPEQLGERVGECYPAAAQLYKTLPLDLAEIMKLAKDRMNS